MNHDYSQTNRLDKSQASFFQRPLTSRDKMAHCRCPDVVGGVGAFSSQFVYNIATPTSNIIFGPLSLLLLTFTAQCYAEHGCATVSRLSVCLPVSQ